MIYPRAMRIDRSRFLALTAAIAACNSQPPAAPTVALEIPSTAATPTPPDAAAPEPSSSAPLVFTPPDARVAVTQDPPDACTTANAAGTVADCTKIRRPSAPQCESFDDTVDECNDMARIFKPAVAEKATRCIVAKSGTSAICQFGVAGACASQAFRASCADPATLAECKKIVQECGSHPVSGSAVPRVTVAECQGALSAIAAKHRPAMLSCMTEGCTSGYCFAYLK